MKKLFVLSMVLLSIMAGATQAQDDGWIKMFNGKDLEGWKVNENKKSVFIEDGCIVTNGPRAHVFYMGEKGIADFKNFHFKAKVKTMPKSNSGIYFHTKFLKSGWPNKGYEAQVNNTQSDPKKNRRALCREGQLQSAC